MSMVSIVEGRALAPHFVCQYDTSIHNDDTLGMWVHGVPSVWGKWDILVLIMPSVYGDISNLPIISHFLRNEMEVTSGQTTYQEQRGVYTNHLEFFSERGRPFVADLPWWVVSLFYKGC